MARPRDFFAACSRAFAARPWACPQCGRAAPPPYAARAACACGHHWSLAATREALLRPFPALAAAADDAERARLAEPAALQAALAKVACACGHCRGEAVARDATGRVICQDCGCAVGDAASCPVCGADLSVPEMRYAPAARRCPECGGALAPSDGGNDGDADEGGAGGACPVCGAPLPPAPAVSLGLWRCPQCGDELSDPGAAPDFPLGQAYPLLLLLALAAGETGAFTGDDWAAAAALRPGLCDNLGAKATDKFSEANWRWLLCAAPLSEQVLSACPWRFAPAALREVASAGAPANRAACPWGGFPDDYWRELLAADAGFFAPRVPDGRWRDVLAGAGGAAARAALPSAVWRRLLLENLAGAEGAPWDAIAPADWAALLAARPEWQGHCRCWQDFSRKDWQKLLAARPEFDDHAKACFPASAAELAGVLERRPDLLPVAACAKLDGREWMRLLVADWEAFAPVCDWQAVAAVGGSDPWAPLRRAPCRGEAGRRLAALAGEMPAAAVCRALFAFPEALPDFPRSALGKISGPQWLAWLRGGPSSRAREIPWAALAPAARRHLWQKSRAVRPSLREFYREVLEGRATAGEVVAMVEALPGIVAARHAKCLQGLSAAQWARVVKAAPRLGRHCPKELLPGLLRHSPEAAGPLGEAVLGAIDAGEWFALLKDRPSLGPLCPYAFAKLTDAQLEELAKPGSPAGVRVPACRCRFSRKLGRFLVAAFALALAAGAALWLLDYIFSGMTNDTIDTVAIVCGVIVGVTLFGLIVKKVDISGRDIRFIGSVLIMIGWGVWWLIKFVLTTVRDWFN